MNIEVIRKIRNDEATIGELYINGKFICDTLEDVDRGLTSDMSPSVFSKTKIMGKTAIPTGSYSLIIDMSSRFNKLMPHILNVKGFEGIRIHAGNTAADTEGCILLGNHISGSTIIKSKIAVELFMNIISNAIKKGEKIIITIK